MAIRTWASADTLAIFQGYSPKLVPASVVVRAHRKLLMLHAAADLRDLRAPPSNRLEKLRGSRKGQFSIRINDQYRVCFTWRSGDAYQVEIVGYHR
jgi:proteic killer suppression protein